MAATPSQALPISLVIVGLLTIVIALVYYYGSRKKHSWLAQCVTLVSWFFPFGIVFLLPLDLASTMYNNCTEATCREPWAYVSQEFLFIAWRTVYWSTFCLTWVIIPFLQSYLSAGGFTVKAKIWYAVRTNLYFYGVYLALGILGLVYIVAYKPFESRAALQGYIIAIANSWGLLLIIIFMGYGLVAIPRHFWNLSNIDLQLDRCYQNAPRLKEELMDAEVELDSLYKELSNVSRKVTTANPLRRHVNDMQREFLADKDFEGNRERRLFQENIPGIIDEKYLSELNRKLKKAVRITERHSALWQRLLNRAFYFQDIMKCRTESSRRFASSSTISTRFVRWQTTAERCAWWWHVRLRPLFLRATSVVTFNVKSPILSIVGISLRSIGQHYGIAELIAFVTLGYMSVCAYSSLLKVKVFNLYLLVPNHHTDELSMLWFGGYLCRLIAEDDRQKMKRTSIDASYLHPSFFPSIQHNMEAVQTYGRKKTATAVAYAKRGRGLIRINGSPIDLLEPEILKFKVYEPILLLGQDRFANMDIRIRVQGGGHTSQVYAIRQALAKAIVAFYQKYVDEASKKEIKDILVHYDRSLLVADPRRCEPKKFGGPGARARYQKSYR
ncbi:hypothetical protein BZG36_04385 [Bifiguratus adelaidae]|uniref:40S ribosomal protein S16 n=1 Tax=Bifiguratus adelaidae TaxID=1938954 RepID=A0A261XVE0_9FUNG|nr:hypothetical protein BZG36_04385 [Bifiguratus adelaidae]